VTGTAPNRWRVRATTARHVVDIEAWADGSAAHVLAVPVPAERRVHMRSRQHLAGHLQLTVRRGRRLVFRGESELAGLERGVPA
jgi:hypothetical protein